MDQVASWFSANGMTLNVEKTYIMEFGLRGKKEHELQVVCNGQTVPQVDQVKYLGLTIDAGLTWGAHIDNLCDRLSSACFALSRLRPSLNTNNVKKAYYGYVHSLLAYGVDLWADAAERERPFRLQKRAIRIMAGAPWDSPARELFKEHKVPTLPSLYVLEVAKYVRKNLERFPTFGDAHDRNTRHRDRLRPPSIRLSKSKKFLLSIGPKVYNAIPSEIKNASNDRVFTNRLKSKLICDALYSVNEFFHTPG
jgi:hypothetical protein